MKDEITRVPRFNRVVRWRDLRPSALGLSPGDYPFPTPGTAIGAIVSLTTDFSLSSGGSTTINVQWDNEFIDDAGFYDAGSPEDFTVPADGWYYVWCNLHINQSGGSFARAWFRNDGAFASSRFGQMDLFNSGLRNSMSATIPLSAGDTVQVRVNIDGTSSVEDAGADLLTSSHFGITGWG